MYMAATHTKTFRPVNMVSPIFSHYLTLRSPRQTTSPAASTSYGQQGRQTGQNCLLGCGSWASGLSGVYTMVSHLRSTQRRLVACALANLLLAGIYWAATQRNLSGRRGPLVAT